MARKPPRLRESWASAVWPAPRPVRAVAVHGFPALLVLSAMSCGDPAIPAPPPPPGRAGPGVPLELAEYRAATLSNVRYGLSLAIPEQITDRVTGRLTLRFDDRRPAEALTLDFTGEKNAVISVTANGAAVPHEVAEEHITIPAGARPNSGAQEIVIDFIAGDQALNRQEGFMYSLFVPDRARTAFPCFDQPDIKARYELSLSVPAGWEALANGSVARLDSAANRFHFAETRPISTYLFAFAAGRFMIEEAERNGRRFRMFHRETDRARVDRSREAIFDLHAAALGWLEDYTGIPYPFEKFDFLAVPAFQFGGMEHPGAIYYRAASLFLEEAPSTNQVLGRASVIAHETSHMWFGDLVTMRWFNDVWMKEVFANFMAARIVAPSFPGINHDLRFLLAHHPAAYEIDRTEGANPIRQELENLREAGSLYGAIIYQKAPIVMRQLEALIGENQLRDGLREYLKRYGFGNATWPDLIAILDRLTSEDLAEWSRVWVTEAGRPRITAQVVRNSDGTAREIRLEQSDPLSPPRTSIAWNQHITVVYGNADSLRRAELHIRGTEAGQELPAGAPAPEFVLPGADGVSYGHFALDDASRDYLLAHLPQIRDPVVRSSAWLAIWESVLYGELHPADFMKLALRALPSETDELIVQHVLGMLDAAYWRFRKPAVRAAIAEQVEDVLWREVIRDGTAARKRAFFDTYVSIAFSDAAVARLHRIWNGSEAVPGVVISEEQFITLARELALRAFPGADGILRAQLGRITNADRRARLQFVIPALSLNRSVRDSVFASFADVGNRRREAWVLEAQAAMNHPLVAQQALSNLRGALDLVQEIQRTGDIFFPQRWLNATLYGHQTDQSAEIVREFLSQVGATYPPRLRAKMLQAADPLFRAAKIAS